MQKYPESRFAANVRAYSDAWRSIGVSFGRQAKRCEMHKGQFSNLRNNNSPNPSVLTALRIAKGLRLSLDDLLTDCPQHRNRVVWGILSHRGEPG